MFVPESVLVFLYVAEIAQMFCWLFLALFLNKKK